MVRGGVWTAVACCCGSRKWLRRRAGNIASRMDVAAEVMERERSTHLRRNRLAELAESEALLVTEKASQVTRVKMMEKDESSRWTWVVRMI